MTDSLYYFYAPGTDRVLWWAFIRGNSVVKSNNENLVGLSIEDLAQVSIKGQYRTRQLL